MFGKKIEIPVRVQQLISLFNALGCDDSVDCLADGNTQPAQGAKVLCALDSDLLTA